jgi:hypothetical protein
VRALSFISKRVVGPTTRRDCCRYSTAHCALPPPALPQPHLCFFRQKAQFCISGLRLSPPLRGCALKLGGFLACARAREHSPEVCSQLPARYTDSSAALAAQSHCRSSGAPRLHYVALQWPAARKRGLRKRGLTRRLRAAHAHCARRAWPSATRRAAQRPALTPSATHRAVLRLGRYRACSLKRAVRRLTLWFHRSQLLPGCAPAVRPACRRGRWRRRPQSAEFHTCAAKSLPPEQCSRALVSVRCWARLAGRFL